MQIHKHLWSGKYLIKQIQESACYESRMCMSRKCMLCLTEKYHTLLSKLNLLNSCNGLVSKCRHEKKIHLSNYKDVPK